MHETSTKVQSLSITEIVIEFQKALVSLYPRFETLDLAGHGEGYDESESIEEFLWQIMVVGSLRWRGDLEEDDVLPNYGFQIFSGHTHELSVVMEDSRYGRFISFNSARPFDDRPYAFLCFVGPGGCVLEASVNRVARFELREAQGDA